MNVDSEHRTERTKSGQKDRKTRKHTSVRGKKVLPVFPAAVAAWRNETRTLWEGRHEVYRTSALYCILLRSSAGREEDVEEPTVVDRVVRNEQKSGCQKAESLLRRKVAQSRK